VTRDDETNGPGASGKTSLNGDPELLAVERALGDLRRGRAVVVRDAGRQVVAMCVETLGEDGLARLVSVAARDLLLAISAQRARALGLANPAAAPLALRVEATAGLAELRALTGMDGRPRGDLVAEPCHKPLSAAVSLARIARLIPAVVAVPLERLPADPALLEVWADQVEAFACSGGRTLECVTRARVPLSGEESCELVLFRDPQADREHLAILVGTVDGSAAVPVRVHSACLTGDVLGSLRCDCGDQLRGAVQRMSAEGGGVLLYLAQEGRGIGLANKLRAYALQDAGLDTFEADEQLGFGADERSFVEAASMLRTLGVTRVRLLTNNPHKLRALIGEGIDVVSREGLSGARNRHNARYLSAKADRAGHLVDEAEDSAAG
jgi:GTP cyclohydrolase II